jgi:LemA protein
MNNGSMGAWLILAIVAVVVVWTMRCYNRLVNLRIRFAIALAQIFVLLMRRLELFRIVVETARRYLQHEQSTLQAVTEARGKALQAAADARSQPVNAATIATLAGAEQTLMGHVGRLLAIAESYPELKADQTLRDLSEQLTTTENQIGFARQAYNDAVLDLNNEVQAFPQLLVARLTGFALAAPLKSTTADDERTTPKVVL